MFQGARALLFKDGIFEKSHYCVVEYLRHNYLAKGKLEQKHKHWLDTYRIERHSTFYGLEKVEVSEDDAKMALEAAVEFLKPVRKLSAE